MMQDTDTLELGTEILPERRAMRCLQHSLDTLNTRLRKSYALPRLRFDLRGRCAGQARAGEWCIRLNSQLLHKHGEEFIQDTVPHELAHLVAYALYGRNIKPHGTQWQEIMALLDKPATVCHRYEIAPARKLQRHSYACDCRAHELTSIRHRRIQAGQHYRCRHCGQTLRFTPSIR